jgi:hypothetical protein
MELNNTTDYYFSDDDESSNDSLYYSDVDDSEDNSYDEDVENDPFKTPRFSFFNKKHNLSVEDSSQTSPNQNSRPYCPYFFPKPSFPENDEQNNELYRTQRKISPSIIDEIRVNFRNLMLELQEGELIIPSTEEMNGSRKRSLSLDIEHVEELILNRRIYTDEHLSS